MAMTRNKPNDKAKPKLVLLCSPIGNLDDISLRTLEVLKKADLIVSEDTRNTKFLLDRYEIKNKTLRSLYSQTEVEESLKLVNKIINENLLCVYLSDAGYPGISDPGSILVKTAIETSLEVSIVPGATASLPALVMSGFDTSSFSFHGFISPKEQAAISYLSNLKYRKETLIFYETSKRISSFLSYILKSLGNRRISISKEITKLHEEYIRGTCEELLKSDIDSYIKGELVVVIEGYQDNKDDDIEQIENAIEVIRSNAPDISNKSICNIVTKLLKVNKNQVYSLVNKKDKED